MDTKTILADLRTERERLDQAISALEALNGVRPRRGRPAATAPAGNGRRRRRRGMSAAARKRMSEMMKARWADRRRRAKAA